MKSVRFVPDGACSNQLYLDSVDDEHTLVVDTIQPDANVTTRFTLNGGVVEIRFPETARDVLDVATTVYVADEQHSRSEADDLWTRPLEFEIPVRDVELWRQAQSALVSAVSFVSGDQFEFDWMTLERRLKPYSRHRKRLAGTFDRVCLFSGGIDSLLGAINYLEAGETLLLVGHQAESASSSAQSELAAQVARRYPEQVSFLQCRIARSRNRAPTYPLPTKAEDTHRTRSFLFLSLGAAVAMATRVNEIAIPENGLIALNIPLETSRLGALSTRTAHPIFLSRFGEFARAVGVFNGGLKNPFVLLSKTDMVREAEAWTYPLLKRSVSCARPLRYQDHGVRHCGYCVPCLYRRLAMMEADLDDSSDYAFDVFSSVNSLSDTLQSDARALARFAKRVVLASDIEVQAMIYRHGWFDSGVLSSLGEVEVSGTSELQGMIRRWADDALAKLVDRCSAQSRRILGLRVRR